MERESKMTKTKFSYTVEEELTFRKEMVLETTFTEEELTEHMEKAERISDSAEEVARYLDVIEGIEVTEYPGFDYASPCDVEIDYYSHRIIK